ncbi:transposable element Tc1 transposase [Trichonephila clavipes]|nr:transposable element Tc1 transposase [Trichonephila clavipes]
MGLRDAAIRRFRQEGVDSDRFQHHDHLVTNRFQLSSGDHRRCVWRRPGQRVYPAFPISRHTGSLPRVMVWDVIPFDSRCPLDVIKGTLTAQRYVNEILRTALLPFLLQYPGLIFQRDNASPHAVRVDMNCLKAYKTLPWSARSPELSPI